MKLDERIWRYLLVVLIAFYILPLFTMRSGDAAAGLLVIIPLVCFVTGIFVGREYGFQWFYAVVIGILFLPSVLIFYNSSALIYCVAFGMVSLLGNGFGSIFRKR